MVAVFVFRGVFWESEFYVDPDVSLTYAAYVIYARCNACSINTIIGFYLDRLEDVPHSVVANCSQAWNLNAIK